MYVDLAPVFIVSNLVCLQVPILIAFQIEELPYIVPGSSQTTNHPSPALASSLSPTASGMHRSAPTVSQLAHAPTNGANRDEEEDVLQNSLVEASGNGVLNGENGHMNGVNVHGTGGLTRRLACIFKVGDDVRQDVLALQVRVE